jgi:hypothetical protein
MGQLPDIVPLAPVIVPPVVERVFDKLWMQRMIVEAPSPASPITVYVELVPFDGETGTTLPSPITHNTVPSAFDLARQDPMFAQVLAGLLLMANKYKSVNFSRPFTVNADGTVTQPVPIAETEPNPIEVPV